MNGYAEIPKRIFCVSFIPATAETQFASVADSGRNLYFSAVFFDDETLSFAP